MELPAESEVFADSANTNYEIEDQLMETDHIALKVHPKSNAKKKRQRKRRLYKRIYA
jgi:predicted metalloenzyme YecM